MDDNTWIWAMDEGFSLMRVDPKLPIGVMLDLEFRY